MDPLVRPALIGFLGMLFLSVTAFKSVLRSIGLAGIACQTDMKAVSWCAFLPLAQSFLFGRIVKHIRSNHNDRHLFSIMPILKTISAVSFYLAIYFYCLLFNDLSHSVYDYETIYTTAIVWLSSLANIINMACLFSLYRSAYQRRTGLIVVHMALSFAVLFYSETMILYLSQRYLSGTGVNAVAMDTVRRT